MNDTIDVKGELLKRVYRSTDSRKLYDKTKELLDEVWDLFMMQSTSKTGRYHPPICNVVPFGLVNHVLRVITFAEHMVEDERLSQEDVEIVMVSALFHDIGKCFVELKSHTIFAAELLKEREFPKKAIDCVYYHMTHWMRDGTWFRARHEGKLDSLIRIVAYSDYLASRQDISLPNEEFYMEEYGMKIIKTKEI